MTALALTPTTALPPALLASSRDSSEAEAHTSEMGGLTGWVLDMTAELGAIGVGALSFLEVVFPPIPSEIVLPLAGYQVQVGGLNLVAVFTLATAGSVLGSLVLYWLGAKIGLERAARLAARIPLVDPGDVYASAEWFNKYDSVAVFTGRFVPGVRSLISLPAGAAGMSLWKFTGWTLLGTGIWNAILIGAGMALGTQYEKVEAYAGWLDYILYAAVLGLLAFGIGRRIVQYRRTPSRHGTDPRARQSSERV
ncbi:DedA family protein [Kineosporia succinea]|uniref:Membrane protein DedA with SNARE-associated domain n=1 Tax=Kineosporia succinea TaxID=84632 RepID=A0ABT9P5I6_9ACTN|nr:DedA family protein [Kineosporia succinea]MDP9827949.1 membrane protein DedA with SNARE-associated domain [Kineosporia succinea]